MPSVRPVRPVRVFAQYCRLLRRLVTRLVELVVHLDDLAVSLEARMPSAPAGATDAVTDCLARVAVARRLPAGDTPAVDDPALRSRSSGTRA